MLLSSKDTKSVLQVTDCQLMHLRQAGSVSFIKKGNAFLYEINDFDTLLNLSECQKLLNWHVGQHDFSGNNLPAEERTKQSIVKLVENIIYPIRKEFGEVAITYGFVSADLNRFIQKKSPSGTYPSIDQHSGSELNKAGNHICMRNGLACDLYVQGFETKMHKIMQFVVESLVFDKLYFYGKERPIHISVNMENSRHLQIMNVSNNGRRIPGKKAFGEAAVKLASAIE